MKHGIWIVLLLAALVLPAYAQQGNNNAQPQPSVMPNEEGTVYVQVAGGKGGAAPQNTGQATQSSGQTGSSTSPAAPAATPGALPPLQAERHEGFWGRINPMARKKYVQRQVEPVRNRVNELDQLTAANAAAIKDVDARAQEGIRNATARANEADQHAIDAGNRAQAADQTAQQANNRLQTVSQAVSNFDQFKPVTDTEIRFRAGQTALSKNAKDALDQMADGIKGQNAYIFEVRGYSAGQGATAIETSQRMADSVVRYLVMNHEVPLNRIRELGLGNAPLPAAEAGEKPRRVTGGRVEVCLLKNPVLEQLSKESPVPTSGSAPASQGGVGGAAAQPAVPPNQSTAPPAASQPQTPPQ
jgi:outer membrane protein OmpA-like peptidoglycan-associated protein